MRVVDRTSKNLRQPPPLFTTPSWMFWSSLLILTALLSASMGAFVALLAPDSLSSIPRTVAGRSLGHLWRHGFQYRLTRPVHILIMGIDRVPGTRENSPESFSGRSDTLLVLRVDPNENSLSMLSLPRDTQVQVPALGWQKLSHVNPLGGPELTVKAVSDTLNDLPIDRYIRVGTGAFRELVDLVDGVEVFVDRPMHYVDNTQGLKIDLLPGWQTLNGKEASDFARFRTDELGDIGRVQRQQAVIKALRQRLNSASVLPRLPQLIRVMHKHIDTNISSQEMRALVSLALQIEPENFKQVMLPGRYSYPGEFPTSYWVFDPRGRDRVLREYFHMYWMGNAWSDYSGTSVSSGRSPKSLRIAIQNATGEPNIARQLAQKLQKQGFYNLYLVEDWSVEVLYTQIIVQKGDIVGANYLKRVLDKGKVEASSTGDVHSDLTIRIGKDWLE